MLRIKVTTNINAENTQQQYATIALLADLEALLGVINTCLPVMKPVFNKLAAARILRLFRTTTAIISPDIGGNIAKASRENEKLSRFIPLPDFSWRPLSRFYPPRAEWEYEQSEMRENNRIPVVIVTTDGDSSHHPSRDDSATLPWRSQWHSHFKEIVHG